jgi:hypothetical protein
MKDEQRTANKERRTKNSELRMANVELRTLEPKSEPEHEPRSPNRERDVLGTIFCFISAGDC